MIGRRETHDGVAAPCSSSRPSGPAPHPHITLTGMMGLADGPAQRLVERTWHWNKPSLLNTKIHITLHIAQSNEYNLQPDHWIRLRR